MKLPWPRRWLPASARPAGPASPASPPATTAAASGHFISSCTTCSPHRRRCQRRPCARVPIVGRSSSLEERLLVAALGGTGRRRLPVDHRTRLQSGFIVVRALAL